MIEEDSSKSQQDETSLASASFAQGWGRSSTASVDNDDEAGDRRRLSMAAHDNAFAAEEIRTVDWIRRFIFALPVGAAIVSSLIFVLARKSEQRSFEEQFDEDARKVLQSFAMSIDLTFGAMDSMSVSMSSHADDTHQTWPFVTIPDFAARAEKTRALTNALYLSLYMHVPRENRSQWEQYTANHGREWVQEALDFQVEQGLFQDRLERVGITGIEDVLFWDVIYDYLEWEKPEEEWGTEGLSPDDPGPFYPIWHISPLIPFDPPYNWDLMSVPSLEKVLSSLKDHKAIFSETYMIAFPNDTETIAQNIDLAIWLENYANDDEDPNEPMVDVYYPILTDLHDYVRVPFSETDPDQHQIGALLSAATYWRDWIKGILPEGNDGVRVVWKSPCNPPFTYQINGPRVEYVGVGDLHEPEFDGMVMSSTMAELRDFTFRSQYYTGIPLSDEPVCPFSLSLYPSSTMRDRFYTPRPLIYCICSIAIFSIAAVVFLVYNHFVEKRKVKLLSTAKQSDAVVANMLPAEIRERLYQAAAAADNPVDANDGSEDEFNGGLFSGGPIAELYPSTTIINIDITGFTAWSSTREPGQVFELLESIYASWDRLAYRRNVMKIESIGDRYIAVAGLPDTSSQHVLAVCRFARDVLRGWPTLTRSLEVKLGPDTTDLNVRIGIHSGQVTAGILRGTMARYQLFGSSMNTTASLQEMSEPGRVHVSRASAELLREHGRASWVHKRNDKVSLTGKGEVQTFWLASRAMRASSTRAVNPLHMEPEMAPITESASMDEQIISGGEGSASNFTDDEVSVSTTNGMDGMMDSLADKTSRLVEWNTQVLADLLQQILAARNGSSNNDWMSIEILEKQIGVEGTVLEEFQEIIELPTASRSGLGRDDHVTEVPEKVRSELRSYLHVVASMYRENHFHNFEHATHVTSSVRKLLSRIVNVDRRTEGNTTELKDMSGHSYGITADPLTQFAVVLSAVIHDCDHPGVPNATLVNEQTPSAIAYKNKSVAEQNSVDICWELLMQEEFKNLRACIYSSEAELLRFRQLIVNVVMATDICDKELGALRKARWVVAFSEDTVDSSPKLDMNRKATIVIEHLIQASDVCHTMQHWEVYLTWNEKFFFELYTTFREGRAAADPSENWYKGEIGFFDFYVIPLAKKLDKCGVFGVSSHEYLDYAQANRDEWERCGEEIVAGYLRKFNEKST